MGLESFILKLIRLVIVSIGRIYQWILVKVP